jgi:hypothetical protein
MSINSFDYLVDSAKARITQDDRPPAAVLSRTIDPSDGVYPKSVVARQERFGPATQYLRSNPSPSNANLEVAHCWHRPLGSLKASRTRYRCRNRAVLLYVVFPCIRVELGVSPQSPFGVVHQLWHRRRTSSTILQVRDGILVCSRSSRLRLPRRLVRFLGSTHALNTARSVDDSDSMEFHRQ